MGVVAKSLTANKNQKCFLFVFDALLRNDRRASSEVRKHFGIVHKTIPPEEEDIALPFAACFKCYKVYSYDGPKTGTSTLSSHKCSNQTQSIQAFISNKPSNTQKKLVTKKAVNLCAVDTRPFEMFSGSGFQQFCQSLLDIAHQSKGKLLERTCCQTQQLCSGIWTSKLPLLRQSSRLYLRICRALLSQQIDGLMTSAKLVASQ
jgi:hypothetical protein